MSFFQEEIIDILLIASDRLIYYDLEEKEKEIKIKKTEVFKADIYSHGIFLKENFEKVLNEAINKYKLNEVGIILHFPNIFFQKITIPRVSEPEAAIKNYLQANLPLPLEKYKFIFREDVYHLSGNLANFNIFFFPKEIEEVILETLLKQNLTIFFISPSIEAILSNLIYEAKITFNENYLIFFVDEKIAHIFYLENLKLERLFLEEISENTNFEIFFQRYHFYFQGLNKKFQSLVFSFKDLPQVNFPIFLINPYEFIAKGGIILLKKIFQDQPFLDFFNLKPKTIYFLTKIRKTFFLGSVFLIIITLLASLLFGFFYSKLNQQEKKLREEVAKLPHLGNLKEIEENLNYLYELAQKIEEKKGESYLKVIFLSKKYELESYDFERREAVFRVEKDKLEEFKKELRGLSYREESQNENFYRVIVNF